MLYDQSQDSMLIGGRINFDQNQASVLLDALHRFQHNGLGDLLMNEILKTAGEDGIAQLFLRVQKVNRPALTLYSDKGFRAVGEESFRVGARDHAAVVMRLVLSTRGEQLQKREISSDRSNYAEH